MKALFTTAVWGEDYVDRFLNYSLRTQLSEDNLGAFGRDSLFLIYTRSGSLQQIIQSQPYRALTDLMQVECVVIDEQVFERARGKYSILTECQNDALSRSPDYDAVFFGYADALWADGSYMAAATRLKQGYDIVFSPGYPVLDLAFKAVLDARGHDDRQAIAIAPRDFARDVYRQLHPMARANEWRGTHMSQCPSYVMWDVPGQGMLTRAFHLHPVAIKVRPTDPDFIRPFRTTLDEEYVARLERCNPRIYVCPTSDEIGVCSFMPHSEGQTYFWEPRRPIATTLLAIFAEGHAGLMQRGFFQQSIRLLIGETVEEKWLPAEQAAESLAQDVARHLATPDSVLQLEMPMTYAARKNRQRTYSHWNDPNELLRDLDDIGAYELRRNVLRYLYMAYVKHRVMPFFQFLTRKIPKTLSAAARLRDGLRAWLRGLVKGEVVGPARPPVRLDPMFANRYLHQMAALPRRKKLRFLLLLCASVAASPWRRH